MRGRFVRLARTGLSRPVWPTGLIVGLVSILISVPLATQNAAPATADPPLTREATEQFLSTAQVVRGRPIGRGITQLWRLTLTDGTVTHDAALNVVDTRSNIERFVDGTFELNFIDSYRYNIAAYRLAGLLDLEKFVPVTVERRWNAKIGALSWWIENAMEEGERLRRKLRPPDVQAWNRQLYRVRLFNNLVYDTDRNMGNMLVTTEWRCWLIDFTRAFRRWKKLPAESDLEMVDGDLLERLRALTHDAVLDRTAPHLVKNEVEALIRRRDLIVERFERLVAERGRGAVVY